MLIDTNEIVSMTEANQNFSKVVKQCEQFGSVVIFKNNKPKFVLVDIDALDIDISQTDDQLDEIARSELNKSKWL